MYKQDPPFAVQVELTEGCNLYCDFCGLKGIRSKENKNWKFMNVATAVELSKQIAVAGWNSRIEFAMHGEPSLNPNVVDIVHAFRQVLPKNQLMMTSNGGGFVGRAGKQKLNDVFEFGLNVLALDNYESANLVPKIISKIGENDIFDIYHYPQQKEASPHKRWPRNTRALIIVKDISVAEEGTHATLNNHCGCGAPVNSNGTGKRCAKPFREVSVRWNGKIAICCNDWRGHYKCGDILETSIDKIWQDKPFQVARKFLYHGMRTINPCEGCDATSYRVGLLPDKLGKETLPKPTKADKAKAASYASAASYTAPVKVDWEV
jgi:radical SAM protein with 4Fe4S-binding SPASM domain